MELDAEADMGMTSTQKAIAERIRNRVVMSRRFPPFVPPPVRHSEGLARFLLSLLVVAFVAVAPANAASGPISTKRPVVHGQATEGGRLVASRGVWAGRGRLRFSYQWYRCDPMGRHCRALHGVTAQSHKAGPNDVGHTLSVAVRATDATGSTLAFASLIGPIGGQGTQLDSLVQPVIVGDAVEGRKVRIAGGRWQPSPATFDYQWARCNSDLRACAAIHGETGTTHTIAAADLGHVLVAIVQARSGAAARAVFSTATPVAVAKGGGSGPTLETAPAIAVVLQVGHELTGSAGSWSGSGAVQFGYSWYRCDGAGAHCKQIAGASTTTYVQGAKDAGHTLGFAVRATDRTGTTTAYAPLLGPVAAATASLVATSTPVLSGTPAPGQTLQVSSGSWSVQPSSISYQWQACNKNGRLCAPIPGATSSSYLVAAADSGHRLVAIVSATAGKETQGTFSAASAMVAAGPPAPAGPTASAGPSVTGTTEQGSQLTGATGTWTGSGTVTYAYNWYRCDAAGAHCLSIHGATKATYTQGAKDAGHTLGFAVHATDAAGTTTAYAALVGPVAAANAPLASTTQPAISGTATVGQALQVSVGNWTAQPASVTYQWERCNANGRLCAPITGATAASYTVTAADSGHTLVAAANASLNGAQQAALSTRTAVVG
jgi:fibronectin-binding autotransporter adhesin